MPRNEDGEFELVLGNRQLLSVFFIVVILLGVFFTMGYIVGKNSAPVSADTAQNTPARPIVVESPARKGADAEPSRGDSKPSEPEARPAEPETRQEPPKPAETRSESKPESKAEPKKEPPRIEKQFEAKRDAKSETVSLPAKGSTYLQVAAVAEKDAEILVDALKSKGFRAVSMQVPEKPQFYRVLVGPLADAAAIAKAREELVKAGFKGNEALKKTF